ncbi:tyrosine-protein phosphatase [Levilactobacillus zymae]|uniref:Protein tyrosine/serine phosphatase n=1 Tax=Levilactobacillus zymae TaxID=267363 RepID=A0A1Y6JU63_9LACO|nr:tyrosine-protein phosphatase [Levilactobacillus zymae]SMS13497.1 Protein tyrosine/serine phosphatase [Levilactobacillus zymae]
MKKPIRTLLTLVLTTTSLGLVQPLANAHAAAVQPATTGRQIKLSGAANVRDLGGYVNRDGKHVRAHKLLRSASLAKLTAEDGQKLVKTYHVKTDVDLRSAEEAAQQPDAKIKGVTYQFNPVVPHMNTTDFMQGDGVKNMETAYRNFVLSKDGKKAYRQLFKTLLKTPKSQAVLYHCSAGKDRTGVATALILSALKVDRATIMNDYLLSNRYLAPSNQQILAQATASGAHEATLASLTAVLGVQSSYLNSSFKAINAKYGNVTNYLHKGLGLTTHDLTQLQKIYLATPKAQFR